MELCHKVACCQLYLAPMMKRSSSQNTNLTDNQHSTPNKAEENIMNSNTDNADNAANNINNNVNNIIGDPSTPTSEEPNKRTRSGSASAKNTPPERKSNTQMIDTQANPNNSTLQENNSANETNSSSSTPPATTPQLAAQHSTSSSSSSSTKSTASSSGISLKTALIRLSSDYKCMENDPPDGCSASPLDSDNLFLWRACVFGPEDSEWEGACLQMQIVFPREYPQKPPTVRFISKMFHPNVFPDGTLCLAKGSSVCCADGIARPIQFIASDSSVLGFFSGKLEHNVERANFRHKLVTKQELSAAEARGTGIITTARANAIKRPNLKRCVKLKFLDGREILCTADHKIMVESGEFVEAQLLSVGEDAVRTSVRGILSPAYNRENYVDNWLYQTSMGVLRCNEQQSASRLYALGLILGNTFAHKNNGAMTAQHELDAEAMQQWIKAVIGEAEAIQEQSNIFTVPLPEKLSQSLVELAGGHNQFPSILLQPDSPRVLKLGFLSALFGALAANPAITGDNIDCVALLLPNSTAVHVAALLADENIGTDLSGGGLQINQASREGFSNLIGFAGNWHKQLQAEIASSLLKSSRDFPQQSYQRLLQAMKAEKIFKSNRLEGLTLPSYNLLLVEREYLTEEQEVYDLSVPLTSSFVAGGVLVHNCLDILQTQWSPIYTVSTILTSIQSLLTDPNNASPANPEAAKLYDSNKKEYRKRVRAVAAKATL
jgi:ubiquitin-protein ligase